MRLKFVAIMRVMLRAMMLIIMGAMLRTMLLIIGRDNAYDNGYDVARYCL